MFRTTFASLAFALAVFCSARDVSAAPPDARPPSPPLVVDRDATGPRSKETFAVLWADLQSSGFKGQHEGLDWAALKARHQNAIESAADLPQQRKAINALLTDLKASHFALIPSDALPTSDDAKTTGLGDTGLRFALADNRLLVERVAAGSPAAAAGVRPGWSVDGIGTFDVSATLKAMRDLDANARRHSETMLLATTDKRVMGIAPDSRVALRLRNAAGKPVALELAAATDPAIQSMTLPGLPPMPLRIASRRIDSPTAGCTLYFEFNQWAMPVYERLSNALREHADCTGVVLDLRGNSGGLVPTLTAVAGLFFEQPTSLGTMTLGDGQTLQLMALPRQVGDDGRDIHRHTGRLAILVDRGSISCSDIFPASLQAQGRARVFGSTSAGMALPAVASPLPSGDRLYHPTADFVDPLKRRIEGVGVVPDQPVVPTPVALAKGGDPVLDAAVAWLSGTP